MPQAAILPFVAWMGAAAATAAAVIQTVLINIALSAASKLLAPKQGAGTVDHLPIDVTLRGTIEARRLVYGTRRVSGVIVYQGASTSGTDGTNDRLVFVVALAAHQVQAIRGIWLDRIYIPASSIDSNGDVTSSQFWRSTGPTVRIYKAFGTSTQTPASGVLARIPEFTSSHQLKGCAYIVVSCTKNDEAFPQGPPRDIGAEVDGMRCYDPRYDSTNGGSGSQRANDATTWTFTRNPAIIWRHYVSGGSVTNDVATPYRVYGVKEGDARIDDAYVIAAANVCDEVLSGANAPPSGSQNRYSCDLECSTDQSHRTIIENILATMAGTAVIVHGKWRLYAGAYQTPEHSLSSADLYGGIKSEETSSHADRYNAVSATFNDWTQEYAETSTLYRNNSSYVTQDGGEKMPLDIRLPGVVDQYQAQRLAEIRLRQSRMQHKVVLTGARNLLKCAINESIQLSHTRYSWSNRIFKVAERQFEFTEDAGRVTLTCVRDDPAVWDDLETADYTTGTSAASDFIKDTPGAPTSLSAKGVEGGVQLSWTRPDPWISGDVFRVYMHTASTPFSSATLQWLGQDTRVTLPSDDTVTRYYWVQTVSPSAEVSATAPTTAGLACAAKPRTPWTPVLTSANGSLMSMAGTIAQKVGGISAWDSSVHSEQGYAQGAIVRFRPNQTNAYLMVGLNSDPAADASYSSIDHAWYCLADGTLQIYESGGPISGHGTYTTNTVLDIQRSLSGVTYLKDGVIVRQAAGSFGAAYLDSSFWTPGGAVTLVAFQPLVDTGSIVPGAATEVASSYTAGAYGPFSPTTTGAGTTASGWLTSLLYTPPVDCVATVRGQHQLHTAGTFATGDYLETRIRAQLTASPYTAVTDGEVTSNEAGSTEMVFCSGTFSLSAGKQYQIGFWVTAYDNSGVANLAAYSTQSLLIVEVIKR